MLPTMVDSSDLEPRITALETQVRELTERVRHTEHDAAAARVLAGGADHDVAEIRHEIRDFRESNTRVLNAMREDLTDLRQHVDTGFMEIRGRLDATAAGQQHIADMLQVLIAKQGDE
jgi:predicted  nucleic acid-binding Zn-ribbon protein